MNIDEYNRMKRQFVEDRIDRAVNEIRRHSQGCSCGGCLPHPIDRDFLVIGIDDDEHERELAKHTLNPAPMITEVIDDVPDIRDVIDESLGFRSF